MHHISLWIPVAFFIIAFAYAMVGFGGGSSYLALLILAGLPYQNVPALALACNLIVTGGAFKNFYKAGHFQIKKILPFVILSIPLSYLGATIPINKKFFSILLGLSLLAVAIRMTISQNSFQGSKTIHSKTAWIIGLPLGGFLGFVSGLLGIGGGIFLSPILLLMKWVNMKEASACASLFIFLNSAAGLAGHLQRSSISVHFLMPLGIAVFIGGQLGSRFSAYQIPHPKLTRIMVTLVLCASLKLIFEAI